MWLWGEENLPERHAARFEALKDSTLKTARAWRIKELWRTFKRCLDVDDAHAFFHKWYVLAMQSKLEPVKKVARSFKAHLAGIVSIFKHGFCNALAEGVNSRIQLLMQKSCGYRNRATAQDRHPLSLRRPEHGPASRSMKNPPTNPEAPTEAPSSPWTAGQTFRCRRLVRDPTFRRSWS